MLSIFLLEYAIEAQSITRAVLNPHENLYRDSRPRTATKIERIEGTSVQLGGVLHPAYDKQKTCSKLRWSIRTLAAHSAGFGKGEQEKILLLV